MEQDVQDALKAITDRLDKLDKPKGGAGYDTATGKLGGEKLKDQAIVPPVNPPGDPNAKSYASSVAKYGVERFVALIKERKAGWPNTSAGLVGAWDKEKAVIDFIADNPIYFKKA